MQNTRQQNPMGQLWSSIQSWFFPVLEDEIGALDDKHRQFVAVCELCAPQGEKAEAKPKAPPEPKRGKRGRRRKDDPPAPPPDPTRLQRQLERDLKAKVPPACMTVRSPSPWRR